MSELLDSRQLRTFVALARTGSFTRTAQEVFLSQSAVSHSMKALESDVGCRLLDRLGRKVMLTQAGEHLLAAHPELLAVAVEGRGIEREILDHGGVLGLRPGSERIGAVVLLIGHVIAGRPAVHVTDGRVRPLARDLLGRVARGLLAGLASAPAAELNLFGWSEYIPQNVIDAFAKDVDVVTLEFENVAVDAANNLYVIHEGRENLKDHPSIFVFDAKGKFMRAQP